MQLLKHTMNQKITSILFQPSQKSTNNSILRFLSIKELTYCLGLSKIESQVALQSLLEKQEIQKFIFRNKVLYGINLDILFTNNPQIKKRWEKLKQQKGDSYLCKARHCYSHLAGNLGVAVYSFFCRQEYFNINKNLNTTLSKKGKIFLNKLGINCKESQPIINCLDWTERRFHIGGNLGKELYALCHKHKLIEALHNSRALLLTQKGQKLWHHLQES